MSASGAIAPAFADVRWWIFDLDNTLYSPRGPIWDMIGARMTAYVARVTGLDLEAAAALQERYLHEHGATLAGLIAHHGVDGRDFLNHVHDIDFARIAPDPELGPLLAALPGRRLVYTNGADFYARRVLERLGCADAFEDVFAMEDADFMAKPAPEGLARLVARYEVSPAHALMVEDMPRNLAPAHALGMKTVLIRPEPAGDFPEHVHHAAECVKTFLRQVLGQ